MTTEHVEGLKRINTLVQAHGSEEDKLAFAELETLACVSLRLFAQTNVSKLREVFRTVEIAAHMGGHEVIG